MFGVVMNWGELAVVVKFTKFDKLTGEVAKNVWVKSLLNKLETSF